MNKPIILIVCICVMLISYTSCSPSLVLSGVTAAKSASNQNKARNLERDTSKLDKDSSNYATYYIYRSGSFVGSGLSCLVYDNNEYITIAKLRTFEKINYIESGDHFFSSKIDAKKSVKVNFQEGKTYIVQVLASNKIKNRILYIMDEAQIKKELKKKKFFYEEFSKNNLSLEDISYGN